MRGGGDQHQGLGKRRLETQAWGSGELSEGASTDAAMLWEGARRSGWAFGSVRFGFSGFKEIQFLKNRKRLVPTNFRNRVFRFSVISVWFWF